MFHFGGGAPTKPFFLFHKKTFFGGWTDVRMDGGKITDLRRRTVIPRSKTNQIYGRAPRRKQHGLVGGQLALSFFGDRQAHVGGGRLTRIDCQDWLSWDGSGAEQSRGRDEVTRRSIKK
jgi:hypothetical protein